NTRPQHGAEPQGDSSPGPDLSLQSCFHNAASRFGSNHTTCGKNHPSREYFSIGAMIRLTMPITLIRMFIDGPEVSFSGSPTVSPTTVALCASEPWPPRWPCSMYFFALSHAPPELAMNSASTRQPNSAPASMPPSL